MFDRGLYDLFVVLLRDLYSAERQIVESVPKLIDAAEDQELRESLRAHLEQTRDQIHRLEKIFAALGERNSGRTCKGIQGLLEEGEEAIDAHPSGHLRDTLIIAAARRVGQYQIAGYGTAVAWARELGMNGTTSLLEATLDEEAAGGEKLGSIAMGGAARFD